MDGSQIALDFVDWLARFELRIPKVRALDRPNIVNETMADTGFTFDPSSSDSDAAILYAQDAKTATLAVDHAEVVTVAAKNELAKSEAPAKPRGTPRNWETLLRPDRFARLATAGFLEDILPAAPPDGVISPASVALNKPGAAKLGKVPGKLIEGGWVGFPGWSRHHTTSADIELWSSWNSASVGLHGRVWTGLDFDIRDEEIARLCRDEMQRRFGPLPYRVGASPKFLMVMRRAFVLRKDRLAFKKNIGDKNEKAQALEALGEGRYFNLDGAHSLEHGPYTWHDGHVTKQHDRVLTHAEYLDFRDWFIAKMEARGFHRVQGARDPDGVDAEHAGRRAGFVPDQPHHLEKVKAFLANERRATAAIEGQGGDDHTITVANICGDLGCERETTLDLMAELWNDRCEPPWEYDDLRLKVYSAFQSRANDVGCDTFEAAYSGVDPAAFEESSAPVNADKSTADRSFLMTLNDIFSMPDPTALVAGLLMEHENICFAGKPKVGKSFVALDICLSISTAQPVFGFLEVKRSGPVVYLSGEGHAGIKRRVKAWCQDRGVDWNAIPFYYKSAVPMTGGGVNECNRFIDGIRAQIGKPVLVVIDTMARSLGGEDENAANVAALYLRMTEELRDKLDCTILTLAHAGKVSDDIRGSSGFPAGFDAVWTQTKGKENRTMLLEAKWLKEFESLGPFAFRIESVKVVDMEHGDGAVLRYIDPKQMKKREDKEAQSQASISFFLGQMNARDLSRAVTAEQLAEHIADYLMNQPPQALSDDATDSQKKEWRRARKAMQDHWEETLKRGSRKGRGGKIVLEDFFEDTRKSEFDDPARWWYIKSIDDATAT